MYIYVHIYIYMCSFFVRHYLIAAANPDVSNHYGWPFRPRSVVVDPFSFPCAALCYPLLVLLSHKRPPWMRLGRVVSGCPH